MFSMNLGCLYLDEQRKAENVAGKLRTWVKTGGDSLKKTDQLSCGYVARYPLLDGS
jgi:hypothetical protein